MQNYDAIVIGSGNGGLSAAATLATAGKKVAVFEKHNIPGGCGTSFCRGRFEFEVALHQLSSMGTPEKPGPLRELFKKYGIEEKIDWVEIKELFRVTFPDNRDYTLPADKEKCIEHLSNIFPKEKENIKRYFEVVYRFNEEASEFGAKASDSTGEPSAFKKTIMKYGFPIMYPTLANYAFKSTQEVLDEFFDDKALQLGLSAYWCFMGVSPELFPFTILAKCTYIYMEDKPYFLLGGSQVMSQALTECIRENGGDVYFSNGIQKILVEDGTAVGVVDSFGKEYKAKKIISNISPTYTYVNLMDEKDIPESAKEYLKPYSAGISALTCFIGLDCPPEEIGVTTSFTLNYDSYDANRDYEYSKTLMPEHDPIVATCYTADDERISPKGTSVMTAGTLKYAQPWEALSPEQYYEAKYKAADMIIERMEKKYPGLRSHIEELEVATPLTHMRYLGHPHGSIYGYVQDIKSSVFFFPTESKVKNLEFSSGWVNACGFGPNYMYGDKMAQKILKEGI